MNDAVDKNNHRSPSKSSRYRYVRVFIYAMILAVFSIVLLAVFIPPWLASKGVEINAISGIHIGKRIQIDELSISVNKTAITIRQLSLEHFSNDQSAISTSSWRLLSPHTVVRLAPSIQNAIKPHGVSINDITFNDITFNLTDLSAPYVFSAHSEQASVTVENTVGTQIPQQVNDLQLVLTTDPFITLTGIIDAAELNIFLPQDIGQNTYPMAFNKGHFSLSWQQDKTPLAVHIDNLTPQWQTLLDDFQQQGNDIALTVDLNQPTSSMRLLAEELRFAQPIELPEFLEKPDDTHEGLHLGHAIANLALLPIKHLKVNHFTYGNLIMNAKLVLDTPRVRENRPDKHAKLHLQGKALGPDEPYDINVLIKHRSLEDADFKGTAIGPKGNKLDCKADVSFISPLPKEFRCEAKFKRTRDLTDRLKLYDIPNAELTKPIIITAKQTSLSFKDNAPSNSAANDPFHFHDVEHASYAIEVALPEMVSVELNRFAFQHAALSSDHSSETIPSLALLELNTDGVLTFNTNYRNGNIDVGLDKNSEELRFYNHRLGYDMQLTFSKLQCLVPFLRNDSTLQCHAKSVINALIPQLFPVPELAMTNSQITSTVVGEWTDDHVELTLVDTQLNIDRIVFQHTGEWIEADADKVTIEAKQINIAQEFRQDNITRLSISTDDKHPITIKANNLDALKLIIPEETSDAKIAAIRQTKNSSQLPVQRYNGQLTSVLSNLAFNIELPPKHPILFDVNAGYQIQLSLNQNNQRLPGLMTEGVLDITPSRSRFKGSILNKRHTTLFVYTIDYLLPLKQANIKLHRNDIPFSSKKSLKKYYLPKLPIDHDITAGSIGFDAKITVKGNQWSGQLGLYTRNLSGYIHNIHYADLNVSFAIDMSNQGIRSRQPISLHVSYLHTGILLENLYALLEFDTQQPFYKLHRAKAYVLGGDISLHNVTSRSLSDIPPVPIRVHGLKLPKLIEAIEAKDIEMTGVIDGILPFGVEDQAPVIQAGKLHARYPGGLLKYKEGSAIDQNVEAASESSLLVVSKILKNYNYHSLIVNLDYSKEGQLSARSHFKGRNPDVLSERPINLNLSLEENIPALIKTLNMINSTKLENMFLKQIGVDK
ncbi:YdbH domain-containing protein [Photobacterium sp. ZSDE20]|uniref:YdbH domain-containing protein n=1 Tax=Photobacterium pectinilyticum TaxID=2906793 RepID=A0ABT1MWS0_9GAMM|nr:YdbH domain-containing protein [Photobacterium sp. ZSDE20]MCQ1056945.1 YdbH domain-containing protein [Photobacterium sp. ZSDE20]MDD1821080.1 YdbH domain-containing protein [Photobacterium sp. ZSDE20]